MGFPRPVLYTLDKGSELSDREKHGVWLVYAMEMFTSRHEGDAMHSPGRLAWAEAVDTGGCIHRARMGAYLCICCCRQPNALL